MILEHAIGEDARQFEQREIFVQIATQIHAVSDAIEFVALERIEHSELKSRTRRGFLARHAPRFARGAQTLSEAFGFGDFVRQCVSGTADMTSTVSLGGMSCSST